MPIRTGAPRLWIDPETGRLLPSGEGVGSMDLPIEPIPAGPAAPTYEPVQSQPESGAPLAPIVEAEPQPQEPEPEPEQDWYNQQPVGSWYGTTDYGEPETTQPSPMPQPDPYAPGGPLEQFAGQEIAPAPPSETYQGPDLTKIPLAGQLFRLLGAPVTGEVLPPETEERGIQRIVPSAFRPSREQQIAAQELTGYQPGMTGQQVAGLLLENIGPNLLDPAIGAAAKAGVRAAAPVVKRGIEAAGRAVDEALPDLGPGLRRLATEERGSAPVNPLGGADDVPAPVNAVVEESTIPPSVAEPPVPPPTGAPPAAGGPDLPTQGSERRRFAQSMEESEWATPVLRQLMTEDPTFRYTPITNDATLKAAIARVEADPAAALARVLDPKESSLESAADALVLLRGSVDTGDLPTLRAVAKAFIPETTETARKLQLLSTIDDMSPEGFIVRAYRGIAEAVERLGGNVAPVAKRLQRAAQDVEIGKVKERSQAQLAAIEKARQAGRTARSQTAVKTIKASIEKKAPIKYNDFMRDMRKFITAEVGGFRLMRTAEFEMPAEDAARFFQKAQDIAASAGSPIEKQKAKEALLKEIEDFRDAAVSEENLRRKAADLLTKWEARQARIAEQAQAANERMAGREIELQASAQEAAGRAAQRQAGREAQAELGAGEREIERGLLRGEKARQSLEAQRQEALSASEESLTRQRERAMSRSAESLEQQRPREEARTLKALSEQRERSMTREAIEAAEQVEYLTDAEARVARKMVQDAEREAIRRIRETVRVSGAELPESVALDLIHRAKGLRDIKNPYQQMRAGQAIMHDIAQFVPASRWNVLLEVLGLSRILKAGLDLSYMGRQGIILVMSHPRQAKAVFKDMVGAFRSEGVADMVDEAVLFGPLSKARLEAGVEWVDRFAMSVARGEETYMSKWAQKLPGIKHSERAYITAGNKQRADVWDNVVKGWLPPELRGQTFASLEELAQATGKSAADFQKLATWVNVVTGRGNAPQWLKSNNQWLSALFFAPRFAISRFQVPYYAARYAYSSPALRKVIARDLGAFVGTNLVALGALSQIPGVEVEVDPRSSDFGKLRYGNLRVDFWGGFQPLVRYVAQAVTGQRKTASGKIEDVDLIDTIGSFLRSKLAPSPSTALDIGLGKTVIGERVELPQEIVREIAMDYTPFLAADTWEAIKEEGILGAAIAAPVSTFGGQVGAYGGIRDVQNDVARERFGGKLYPDLFDKQKEEVDNDPKVQAKVRENEQRQQIDSRKLVAVSMQNYHTRNEAIELGRTKTDGTRDYGLKDYIQAGMKGKDLADKIKEAKTSRYENGQTTFNAAVEAALKKGVDAPLKDVLREAYWAAAVPEDVATGDLDFDARDTARAAILRQASQAGIDSRHITEKRSPWKDPVVREAVERYEQAQEVMKPYYDVSKTLLNGSSAYRLAKTRVDAAKASGDQQAIYMAEHNPVWLTYQRAVDTQREKMRRENRGNNPLEKALEEWRGLKPLVDPTVRPERPMRPVGAR